MTNPPEYDVAICGGGIIGLSIAYEAANRGWSVVVLDQAEIGKASSWAGAGILPASPVRGSMDSLEQLRDLSHRMHPIWANELHARTGIDTGFSFCGGIHLARTTGEYATLFANQQLWDEHGIRFQKWNQDQLREHEPWLATHHFPFLGAWHFPDEAQLRNPRHIQALYQACVQQKVDFYPNTEVTGLEVHRHKIQQIQTRNQSFRAKRYCVSGGAWTRLILATIGIATEILPVRGQMLLFRTDKPLLQNVVNDGHRYLVPRTDGHLLAGSCEEEVGFVVETTDSMIRELHQWAIELLPPLSERPMERSWAGLRPGSFDGLPYIGRLGQIENGFIAAGHFRHGIHLSTGTAKVLVDLMANIEPEINLSLFRVGRGQSSLS